MFMLKDSQGRVVLVKESNRGLTLGFYAKVGAELDPVNEATICVGEDVYPNPEHVQKVLNDAGLDWVKFVIQSDRWSPVDIQTSSEWVGGYSYSSNQKRRCTVSGRIVDEETYNKTIKIMQDFQSFRVLNPAAYGSFSVAKKAVMDGQSILALIGDGKVVTPSTFVRGCAKDETRPRLMPGDSVTISTRGKPNVTGTILKMGSKVSVVVGSKRVSVTYDRLTFAKATPVNQEALKNLEPTLRENLDYVLAQKHRLYRVKTEKKSLSMPMFPEPNERQTELTDTPSCVCPLCGWQMAEFSKGSFTCCFCKVSGLVITRKEDEVVLLMDRWPAKNRFNIKEVRCCSNCGRFQFEYGRQGKRTTGYCKTSNQCVQAHNTCKYWFPADTDTYSSNMKQHVTNLGYGVQDRRNTERNDIRDTIYREEDHKKERERAEKAKMEYFQAYNDFMAKLVKLADKAPLYGESLDEKQTQEWKDRLDDGC